MTGVPTKPEIDKALHTLIEQDFWIDTLGPDELYSRIHDDNDGHTTSTAENSLQVYIAQDGDLHVFLPGSQETLRFRNYFGGGKSLRVRNALLVLAEAIRRDNAERPQGRPAR